VDKTFEKKTSPAGKSRLPGIVHFCELQRKTSVFFPLNTNANNVSLQMAVKQPVGADFSAYA